MKLLLIQIIKKISVTKVKFLPALFLYSLSFLSLAVDNTDVTQVINKKNNDKQSYQRIIALAPHIVEMLFELGVGDKIIGTTAHSDYPAAANKIPRIGNYARLKIEDILASDPDLIIAWRTGNPSDDLARLEQLGLNVVYSDPQSLADVAKELRYFGQLTNVSGQAELQAKKYESNLLAIKNTYQNRAPISTFYELWSRPLTTVSQHDWPQQHLNVCGASNPFVNTKGTYPQIGLEQVVIAKPQLIIQPESAGEPNPDAVNWRQWQEVPAAKHNQFIQPNSDKLHRMTPRLLIELEQLCISIDKARLYYQSL
jgi:vitamin B12 transport system substrate-binding protein